ATEGAVNRAFPYLCSSVPALRSLGVGGCICGFALLLWAATGTVAPTGDNTTGSWSTAPLWSKVNDDIDAPDGTTISSPTNPATPTNDVIFNVTCPGDTGAITEANLRIRARKSAASGREISFAVSWSATAATNFSTGNLTDTLANYASGNQTGLSISKGTCDASTLKVAPTTSGSGAGRQGLIDSFNLDITYAVSADQPPLRRTIVID
ncbi:MAG: hypothetical protein ACRD4D_08345, partial [Candidatus Acidiferrales bacterium]